jgi:hypothetical protein
MNSSKLDEPNKSCDGRNTSFMNPHLPDAMSFPAMAEVEAADHRRLDEWYRFLVAPAKKKQMAIMKRMFERFHASGRSNTNSRKRVSKRRGRPTTSATRRRPS